jgi:hypothetical protein
LTAATNRQRELMRQFPVCAVAENKVPDCDDECPQDSAKG